MNRLKKWLINKYLPAYARFAMNEENEKLKKQATQLESENALLQSYIRGMERALRAGRTEITLHQGGSAHGDN